MYGLVVLCGVREDVSVDDCKPRLERTGLGVVEIWGEVSPQWGEFAKFMRNLMI